MMTKQFTFRSKEIGQINVCSFVLITLVFFSFISIGNGEMYHMNGYDYESFSSFFGFIKNDDCTQLMFTPVLRISESGKHDVETLLSAFPEYNKKATVNLSEMPLNSKYDDLYYIQYNLTDNSSLHFFCSDVNIEFVCYLVERCELNDFDNIVIGESTPSEVFELDANTAFNPLLSSGPYSFHYLRDGSFLRIKYSSQEKTNLFTGERFELFTVKSIELIDRENCNSVLRYIYFE